MVLKLRVECMRGRFHEHECVRIIAMDDSSSLIDLHDMIQDAVSFGRDHLFDFYTANSASWWADRHWITDVEDWDEKEMVFLKTQLKSIWPLGRRRLYYWFDFGDDWIFEIRKMRHAQTHESLSTPLVLERSDRIQCSIRALRSEMAIFSHDAPASHYSYTIFREKESVLEWIWLVPPPSRSRHRQAGS